MRSINEIPLKSDATKKYNLEWQLAYPNMIFSYPETKDDKTVRFEGKFDFNCLLEKFGIKKDEIEINNVNNLIDTMTKYFKDNKVTIEPWQLKYYAVEFKSEEDKTLFKVYLKDD